MLTAEWIDGYKITDLDSIKKDYFDIADIDKKLFKIFSEQIFNTGFVHAGYYTFNFLTNNPYNYFIFNVIFCADPHPGNGKSTWKF